MYTHELLAIWQGALDAFIDLRKNKEFWAALSQEERASLQKIERRCALTCEQLKSTIKLQAKDDG